MSVSFNLFDKSTADNKGLFTRIDTSYISKCLRTLTFLLLKLVDYLELHLVYEKLKPDPFNYYRSEQCKRQKLISSVIENFNVKSYFICKTIPSGGKTVTLFIP